MMTNPTSDRGIITSFEEFTWHSNRIEQVWKNSDEQRIRQQIKRLFINDGKQSGIDPNIIGHWKGWHDLNLVQRPAVAQVREIHATMFVGCELHNGCKPGVTRDIDGIRVTVAGSPTPEPEEITELLEKWSLMEDDPWPRHYEFERIHPFADGNGRVGRMLLAAEIGLEAATVRYEGRFAYYDKIAAYVEGINEKALRRAQEERDV